jgi:hypothetical protein
MIPDGSSESLEGTVVAVCPVCQSYIYYPQGLNGPDRHRCSPAALAAIDRDRDERRRSGRNPARSVGERIEEGFRMMEIDN